MLTDLLVKNASSDRLYVEDVFSTWLYSGSSADQTITNGINLLNKGGMVWVKNRNNASGSSSYSGFEGQNILVDTARGMTLASFSRSLVSNLTNAQSNLGTGGIGANSNGFTVGYNGFMDLNLSSNTYSSWTFRKAPKFFDVVTYTGNASSRTISHSLGVAPGLIIIKRTDNTSSWAVYHRSISNTEYLALHSTAAVAASSTIWASTTATDAVFSVGNNTIVNASGGSYVAYLFAHDTTADGIVQCGSFTTDGSGNATASLGFEPQFVLFKASSAAGSWRMYDNMRGIATGGNDAVLYSNLSAAEENASNNIDLNATGFSVNGITSSQTFIYLAIRRGPMKVPTDATTVFSTVERTGTNTTTVVGSLFADAALVKKTNDVKTAVIGDRLRGAPYLQTASTAAEATSTTDAFPSNPWDINAGFRVAGGGTITDGFTNYTGDDYVNYIFRRAPGFFDAVAYTGTGVARTVSHSLGVAPELMIAKRRDSTSNWQVYAVAVGATKTLLLNTTSAAGLDSSIWNNTAPTSTVFSVGTGVAINNSGSTYVAYLFASCPGVSKVGSYTGTGTTLQINCGFTNGARFVLIKRTDSTGDWYVYDSARGIIAGNDPYLLLNSTAAEVTNTDYVDAYSAGFELSSTAPAALNANGGTYIYLAIA